MSAAWNAVSSASDLRAHACFTTVTGIRRRATLFAAVAIYASVDAVLMHESSGVVVPFGSYLNSCGLVESMLPAFELQMRLQKGAASTLQPARRKGLTCLETSFSSYPVVCVVAGP